MRPVLRLPLGLALLLLLALAPQGQAGTVDDPEILDPVGDATPATTPGAGARDLVKVWFSDEFVDMGEAGPGLVLNIDIAADIQQASSLFAVHERMRVAFVPNYPGGLPDGAVEVYVTQFLGFVTTGAPAETSSCRLGSATAAGGSQAINTETALTGTVSGAHYECRIPTSALGNLGSAPGQALTGIYAKFELVQRGPTNGGDPAGVRVLHTYDSTAVGRDYVAPVTGGAGNLTDTDADGLNDTWEQEHFGNLTAQNATGDPDADNQTNLQEFLLGTDPNDADTDDDGLDEGAEVAAGTNATNPDTDGDGFQDGAEVEAGSDPLDAAIVPDEDADPSPGGPTGEDNESGGDDDDSDGGAGTEESSGLDGYIDSIKDDTGYAGASAAGMTAVLILSLIGLAGRWGL